ncbi:Uncharacterised protein [Bordetella pertussis]|nr:Uncharacterised protein [Bordetella pertussis]
MHQALTSSTDSTCTSHGQLAASARNTPVCAIRRWEMARTRDNCAGSRSSSPLARASWTISAYCCPASCTSACSGTRLDMYWVRSTPIAPDCVVLTPAQPASSARPATAAARRKVWMTGFMVASLGKAHAPRYPPHWARWRNAWSMSTSASSASAMGVARMPTQGSWRPRVCTITGSPARLTERRSTRMLEVGLIASDTVIGWPVEMPPSTPPA